MYNRCRTHTTKSQTILGGDPQFTVIEWYKLLMDTLHITPTSDFCGYLRRAINEQKDISQLFTTLGEYKDFKIAEMFIGTFNPYISKDISKDMSRMCIRDAYRIVAQSYRLAWQYNTAYTYPKYIFITTPGMTNAIIHQNAMICKYIQIACSGSLRVYERQLNTDYTTCVLPTNDEVYKLKTDVSQLYECIPIWRLPEDIKPNNYKIVLYMYLKLFIKKVEYIYEQFYDADIMLNQIYLKCQTVAYVIDHALIPDINPQQYIAYSKYVNETITNYNSCSKLSAKGFGIIAAINKDIIESCTRYSDNNINTIKTDINTIHNRLKDMQYTYKTITKRDITSSLVRNIYPYPSVKNTNIFIQIKLNDSLKTHVQTVLKYGSILDNNKQGGNMATPTDSLEFVKHITTDMLFGLYIRAHITQHTTVAQLSPLLLAVANVKKDPTNNAYFTALKTASAAMGLHNKL
jgi:hypothetical protein